MDHRVKNQQETEQEILELNEQFRAFLHTKGLGVSDAQKLAFAGAALKNAIGYSGLNKAPSFQIAVSSFRGETTISSLVRCSPAEKKKVDLILDAIAGEIRSFL